MKKWIASILCLVMVLSSISALAALPAPDASKKPAEVTVNITEDADGYLLLTVSDGGKDYYVHGSFITDRSDNKNATFSWNDEKNAYVSYSPVKGYSGKYNYVEVNNGYGTSSIYRQIGGEIYDSYVAINNIVMEEPLLRRPFPSMTIKDKLSQVCTSRQAMTKTEIF